ncbi:MAG: transcription termination/antitermination protein NusA [Clostridia bacterium]|nr:transcription termination/antitermination protein NusA [Clostridia bacterium]
MQNEELFLALDQIEAAYKLDKSMLIASLEAGLASAFKKESGESRAVVVRMYPETFSIEFFAYQTVVEGEPQEDSELSLEEAREIKEDAQIGDLIGEVVSPDDLSRIAAQTAKQVITQRINEAKREQAMSEMSDREGELMQAIVRRVEANGTVYVEISGTQMEGVLGTGDQVRGERLFVGDHVKVYVKKVRTDMKGTSRVMVSRSCAGFVKKLFEIEVPEIRTGLVKIKNIVREAGLRTKMSVYSEDPNVDSIGSCIGPKGSRVNAIVNELGGEKVDVILYSTNPSEYIVRALSPAKVIMVQLNETAEQARVIVPDDKLSLAIGKGGQNAKLAAKLTGYKIDVKPYSVAVADDDTLGLVGLSDEE